MVTGRVLLGAAGAGVVGGVPATGSGVLCEGESAEMLSAVAGGVGTPVFEEDMAAESKDGVACTGGAEVTAVCVTVDITGATLSIFVTDNDTVGRDCTG